MLDKVKNTIATLLDRQVIKLGEDTAVWKKVNQLQPGMKIATTHPDPQEGDQVVFDET